MSTDELVKQCNSLETCTCVDRSQYPYGCVIASLQSRLDTAEAENKQLMDDNGFTALELARTADKLAASEAARERLNGELTKTISIARSFLDYFNPAVDLPSAKEDQWWSLRDQCERAECILSASPPNGAPAQPPASEAALTLGEQQEELGPDFAKVLDDNRWDLYARAPATSRDAVLERLAAALEPFAAVARGDKLNPTPQEWAEASATVRALKQGGQG